MESSSTNFNEAWNVVSFFACITLKRTPVQSIWNTKLIQGNALEQLP